MSKDYSKAQSNYYQDPIPPEAQAKFNKIFSHFFMHKLVDTCFSLTKKRFETERLTTQDKKDLEYCFMKFDDYFKEAHTILTRMQLLELKNHKLDNTIFNK